MAGNRISLVEQYNNKDVITQIYDLKDTVGDFDEDIANATAKAETAYSTANAVKSTADTALTTAQGAKTTADSASDTASEAKTKAVEAKTLADVSVNDAIIKTTAEGGNLYMDQNDGGQKATAIPIASSTQAGLMNAQTFQSISSLDGRVSALESKQAIVYVTFPSTSPTQAEITSLFTASAGRAPVKGDMAEDIAKALIYQYDGSTWIQTQGTSAPWSNTTAGLVKGSASGPGTIFAETDGTGSVNGWDDLSASVETNASNITGLTKQVNSNALKLVTHDSQLERQLGYIQTLNDEMEAVDTKLLTIPKIQQATVVLSASSWSSSLTQTVSCAIATASNIIWVAPQGSPASYGKNGVYCSAQGDGTLTFTCTTVPQDTYTVNIVTADI